MLKKVICYLMFVVGLASLTVGFGSSAAEARTFFEGNEETKFLFIPTIEEDGSLRISQTDKPDYWQSWSLGTGKFTEVTTDGSFGMSIVNGVKSSFETFHNENGKTLIKANDFNDYYVGTDDTGYFVLDAQHSNQINIGYTRSANRMQKWEYSEDYYEAPKTGLLYGMDVVVVHEALTNLRSEKMQEGVYHTHPVLRFEAAKIKGDTTSQFSVGSNLGSGPYYYYGKAVSSGYETSQVYNYQGCEYQTFYLPLGPTFASNSSLFIDVDNQTTGSQTEYSFKNIQVVLERYVPLNEASYEELLLLDGIGVTLAQRIMDYRQENYFTSIDDLANIKGIGTATISKIKAQGLAKIYNYFN